MYNWLIYCYCYYYIYTYITKIMSSKIKLTNNIIKMCKPESSHEDSDCGSDCDNDTETSSDVSVSDDDVEWITESESESYNPKRSGGGRHDNKRRKFVVESDDDEESDSEEDTDADADNEKNERDCGKSSDDRSNKNRPAMSVVKHDDKQKRKYKSSYNRNNSDSERESDSDSTDEMNVSGHNCKKRKNKNVSPKNRTVQHKKPCANSVIAKKGGDKNDEKESDSDEDYKPPSTKRKSKNGRENKNNRDVSDISIILAALDNEFLEDEGFVVDSENDECNSEDEETFMHETYKKIDYPNNPENDKNKMCVEVGRKKIADKPNKGCKTDKKMVEPDVQEDVDAEYKSLVDLKNILIEKLTRNPKNKFVLKSLKKCKEEIVSLIKRSRTKNTTDYYNLVKNESADTDEFSFFRKKLSNTQQKNIVKQLKDINDHIQVGKPHRLMLLETDIPIKYKATVMQKLNILESMDSSDQEYYKIKNWVDTFMRIPFMKYKNLSVNIDDGIDKCSEFIENSRNILDDCVYGMNDAKIQILQLLGQWVSNPAALGSAIGIYGPPGTAKTTIVKNGISKILGREFAFISLGGAGDSSFLDGHSYTYEGSSWGKIIQILIDSKCMNPVIYFDELDKVSDTPRGEEIINNLMHIIDTTQNSQFHDKYFSEVDFDISKCLFIFSYNDESKVNAILKDRMYRIKTSGYSCKDKIIIARKHILPKIIEQVKFAEGDIVIPDDVLEYIITENRYTQNEEGVRNLKRCLEIIHTKLNLYRLVKPGKNIFGKSMEMVVEFPFTVTKNVVELLVKNESTQTQSFLSMYV